MNIVRPCSFVMLNRNGKIAMNQWWLVLKGHASRKKQTWLSEDRIWIFLNENWELKQSLFPFVILLHLSQIDFVSSPLSNFQMFGLVLFPMCYLFPVVICRKGIRIFFEVRLSAAYVSWQKVSKFSQAHHQVSFKGEKEEKKWIHTWKKKEGKDDAFKKQRGETRKY